MCVCVCKAAERLHEHHYKRKNHKNNKEYTLYLRPRSFQPRHKNFISDWIQSIKSSSSSSSSSVMARVLTLVTPCLISRLSFTNEFVNVVGVFFEINAPIKNGASWSPAHQLHGWTLQLKYAQVSEYRPLRRCHSNSPFRISCPSRVCIILVVIRFQRLSASCYSWLMYK